MLLLSDTKAASVGLLPPWFYSSILVEIRELMIIPKISRERPLTQFAMDTLIKAGFSYSYTRQFTWTQGRVQDVSTGHGQEKSFYSSRVAVFQMGYLAGK